MIDRLLPGLSQADSCLHSTDTKEASHQGMAQGVGGTLFHDNCITRQQETFQSLTIVFSAQQTFGGSSNTQRTGQCAHMSWSLPHPALWVQQMQLVKAWVVCVSCRSPSQHLVVNFPHQCHRLFDHSRKPKGVHHEQLS